MEYKLQVEKSPPCHGHSCTIAVEADKGGLEASKLQVLHLQRLTAMYSPGYMAVVFIFIYLFNKFIYLFFIPGCVGSLLQSAGFSLQWLLLLWSMVSRRAGFSSCGLRALERRLSSCGARA